MCWKTRNVRVRTSIASAPLHHDISCAMLGNELRSLTSNAEGFTHLEFQWTNCGAYRTSAFLLICPLDPESTLCYKVLVMDNINTPYQLRARFCGVVDFTCPWCAQIS